MRQALGLDQALQQVKVKTPLLGLDQVAVVGHDSGGLIARHAIAGDERVAGVGLVNTEPPGWMTAVIPSRIPTSTPSRKGKKASDTMQAPFKPPPAAATSSSIWRRSRS